MNKNPIRTFRDALELLLPILGIATVLGAVTLVPDPKLELGVVVLGLVLIEAGVWNLARPVLPNTRQYLALRGEVDYFLQQVRRLNTLAVEHEDDLSDEAREHFQAVQREMQRAVDRMAAVAGKTETDLSGKKPRRRLQTESAEAR